MGQDSGSEKVMLRLAVSPPRRLLGTAALVALGIGVALVGLREAPGPLVQAVAGLAGAGALWLALWLWRATALGLELTEAELRDTGGRRIVRLADVQSVDGGSFALRPASGFALIARVPQASAWQPGLWWRVGVRIGVGGMTPRRQTREMADLITVMISRPRPRGRRGSESAGGSR